VIKRYALALLALLFVSSAVRADNKPRLDSFSSGGKTIKVEQFVPAGKGKFPVLLLLHGSSGLGKRGDEYRAVARLIAGHGYAVLLVHYFDRTGTTDAGDLDAIQQHFHAWVATVHDGVAYAKRLPFADPARVGLVGFSLGGYLSLSAAALAGKEEYRVKVVVEFFGGLPSLLRWGANALPPTLILHGEKDEVVSPREARELEKLLRRAKVPYEVRVFPGEGHGFSDKASREAMEVGFAFLDKHFAPRK
jgi:carboxymethylenebutenolidase